MQVRRRQYRVGFFRPFNDADVVAVEVLAEAGVEDGSIFSMGITLRETGELIGVC
eukprot:gene34163-42124_t